MFVELLRLCQGCTVSYTSVCVTSVQEGVGDPSSGDSGAVLRHAVRSVTWCSVSHCVRQKRPHLVLLGSVILHMIIILDIILEIDISFGINSTYTAPCLFNFFIWNTILKSCLK